MGWLDDGFDENLKVQLLPDERAAWLYIRGLLYCRRNPKARGRISKRSITELTKMPRPKALAAMLATDYGAGLLWEDDGPWYKIHDWEIQNERAVARGDELEATQAAARKAKAQKAAAARWSNAQASSEHDPSNAPSNAQASADQCSDDASHVRGRAPDPIPIPVSPSPAQASVNGAHGDAQAHAPLDAQALLANGAEMDRSKGKTQARDVVAERWLTIWPVKMLNEAREVLALCRAHVGEQLIDEAIGHVVGMKPRPRTPRYLLTIVADWANQRGANLSDESVAALATGAHGR